MKIENAVILVTGSNRGIGAAFMDALLARGARKIYAAARNPPASSNSKIIPLKLDITNADDVRNAAVIANDVCVVINNAGVGEVGGFLHPKSEEVARRALETNFFGMLRMSQVFAPILKTNGGGALMNVLSVVTWINSGQLAAYGASKSAAWSLTNSLRHELSGQKTQVTALHMALVDTDMTRGFDLPKSRPEDIVKAALDGLEAGDEEVLADDQTRMVKKYFNAARPSYFPPLA